MGDPFQKVQRGDRLRIPAETFNTFIDAAKDFRSRTQNRSRTTQPEFPQAGIILVKNETASDLDRFHVLGLERPIFTPAESLFSFQDQIAVVGAAPNEEDHVGRFLILQEPLRSGMIGRACICGVTRRRRPWPGASRSCWWMVGRCWVATGSRRPLPNSHPASARSTAITNCCTLFRVDVFREALFTARQQPYVDFDPAFYERLKSTGLQAKVCWDAECQHLANDTRPIMTWDHWPESWETMDLTTYRAGFLTGREACQWIVDTLNGPEPAAIWGLSDGDLAWWCYDALTRTPGVDREWLDALALTSGLHPEDRNELWPLFDAACRHAPHWLVQHGWDIAERFSHAALTAHGVTIDAEGFGYARGRKRKIDCNAVYKLLDEGLWWSLDYSRICLELGRKPPLLFVAHREEILRQALGSFRGVLRDQNFGDLLVGGRDAEQEQHLFCSIQSYNSRDLVRHPSDAFEYIVVDEFHHAAAPSYRLLLDHVQPQILLGLTATPERSDQLDILQWFGGRTSAEIRLPDAINRRLLCPFQYFGVSDAVDLDGLTWQRGGYRVEELDNLYTGNDIRARLVLDKVDHFLLNPRHARGLGFCVSKAHAEFMARYFGQHGLPSAALTADSPDDLRRSVQERLRTREINFIFVVDLYNEGVDIPEVDTVLFLRPTESLTVYLQQLGRGLRQHAEKECLTVLDFIGAQRREFRFASRFRALSTKPEGRLDREIEHGFPHLPSGCVIQLERVAQQRVLDNVRESVRLLRPRMIGSLRDLGRYLGRAPSIEEALNYFDTSLDELLKRGLWTRLLADAGLAETPHDPDEDRLAKGLRRISHVECADQIRQWHDMLEGKPLDGRLEEMLHVSLWGTDSKGWTLERAAERLWQNPAATDDLRAILQYRLRHVPTHHAGRVPPAAGPLTIHAAYTRDEILVGLGHWSLENRPDQREGVLHVPATKVDAFFVTLQKTEEDYSPTTMYEDYLISPDRFHWQSQSNTSVESPTGQRYINHRRMGYTPLLFVREARLLPSGLSAPYYFLGPCEYVSHEGSRPISIVWRLLHTVPARLFRAMARQSVG